MEGSQLLPESVAFPCTVAQKGHWALDKLHPGDPTLNIAARWRLEGHIDAVLLEQSLQIIVARHEILRTGFIERVDGPLQMITASAPLILRLIDLTGLPDIERSRSASENAREEARRAFDLSHPPLLRATLICLEPEVRELLITTHHLVGDCWSNGILAREVAETYDALRNGNVAKLPLLEMQFADYACWQVAWLEKGGAASAEAYWRRQLYNLPSFHVPIEIKAPLIATCEGEIMGMPVPEALVTAAKELARSQGVTFFMLGAAAMATLLCRWTGAAEVVFGSQVAGRDELELEPLVGHFVNTVVLRVKTSLSSSFVSLLDHVRETVGEALEHAAAPIDRVLEDLLPVNPAGGRRSSPIAVNFLVQRAFTRDVAHGDLTLRSMPNVSPGSRYDLNLFLVERPDGWRASCEFDPQLFERARVDWFLRSFLGILQFFSLEPSGLLSSVFLFDQPTGTGLLPDIETQLSAIWSRVLHQKVIPRGVNFFTLGGDSVRAAQMLVLTKLTLGRSISLGQLFKSPTLSAMAALLCNNVEDPASGVVWVQPHGSKPPIFAINNTGIFHALAQHLGSDQPFASVQALDPNVSPSSHPDNFPLIAQRYVDLIRQVRPHGPYMLIGLCAAGKVAFEVARHLVAAGEEVRLLAVVDSWAPGHFRRMATMVRLRARLSLRLIRCGRQIRRIRGGTLSISGFLANRAAIRTIRNMLFETLRRSGRRDDVPPGVQNNLFVSFLDRAAGRYEPRPYAGNMLVFYGPEQPRGRELDPSFGWEGLVAGKVRVIAVPADEHAVFVDHHQGLFQDPGARVMAGAIAEMLRQDSTS